MNPLGINLSFAVKRWVEPEAWARKVESTGLNLVQFSFDLIDPLWPVPLRNSLARLHDKAAKAHDLQVHSAFVGLACYTYNNLLHPLPEGREAAKLWWRGAIETAIELGTTRVGGPLGGMSVWDDANPVRRNERLTRLGEDLRELLEYAQSLGIAEWLIEPTPLTREIPFIPEEAKRLLDDLSGSISVKLCVDIGHALYHPLYGEKAQLDPWLALGDKIGLLHLQQTDGLSDSHWGFNDPRGIVVLPQIRDLLLKSGHKDLPVVLEIFYPFEVVDELVWQDVSLSVAKVRQTWD
jgi:sugar phosphate isomerase/epimerase